VLARLLEFATGRKPALRAPDLLESTGSHSFVTEMCS